MQYVLKFEILVRRIFALLGLLVILSACNHDPSTDIAIYVAVDGTDSADGSLANPFRSIPQALSAVRELRKSGNQSSATIFLREGEHTLSETLVIDLEDGALDNNSKESHLTFAAYKDERPVIGSGIPIDDWTRLEDHSDISSSAKGKIWMADIPEGLTTCYTLYDNDGRLNRARAEGFIPTKTADKYTIHYPGDKIRNWDNLQDVEINIRPSRAWMINMLPLDVVDEESQIAKTKVAATYDIGPLAKWVHTQDGQSAWIENTLESLDQPGEWVIDSQKGKIYLWPRLPASDGAPEAIIAPKLTELIRVEGEINYDAAEDKAVKGITFSGITFTHADRRGWTSDEDRLGWGVQHDWDLFDRPSALLRFRGAEDCQVVDCHFENSGGTGVRFDLHAQNNRVENCEFAHLGEAGILMFGYGPGTKDVNHHNTIVNNHIHHFSEITWHSPGIWAWQSGHNRIANNYIHHSGYAGVLVTNRVEPDRAINGEGGRTVRHHEIPQDVIDNTEETYSNWQLREKYNHARHNIVEYNEITHCVQLLSDGNAIYVSGAGTGNIIRHNYIHDNLEHSMPSAIRCDDDQHETLIYGNVLNNNFCFAAGIVSKGVNDIVNNLIINPLTVPRYGYVSFEWVSVKNSNVKRNIIVAHDDGGIAFAERPRAKGKPYDGLPFLEETVMDSNLYYHPTDPTWMSEHISLMRAVGNEQNGQIANPMFIDAGASNFGFREGSPAIDLGIASFDISEMGLTSSNR